jgi:hypothetical protein
MYAWYRKTALFYGKNEPMMGSFKFDVYESLDNMLTFCL